MSSVVLCQVSPSSVTALNARIIHDLPVFCGDIHSFMLLFARVGCLPVKTSFCCDGQ